MPDKGQDMTPEDDGPDFWQMQQLLERELWEADQLAQEEYWEWAYKVEKEYEGQED